VTEATQNPVVIVNENTDDTHYQYCGLTANRQYYFEVKSIIGTQKSNLRRSEAFETFQYG